MMFPNGSVITDDGRTLIVGETAGARYTAFTIGDDGALGDRRVWAQLAPTPELGTLEETLGRLHFGPDGCCLDAEEHIWSADEVNARCCRVAPGGEVVDEVPAPEGLDVFACMLGGEDGRTLLICAAPDFHEHARSQAREAVLLPTRSTCPTRGCRDPAAVTTSAPGGPPERVAWPATITSIGRDCVPRSRNLVPPPPAW
jgi:sugar lactone lactonase YvrE